MIRVSGRRSSLCVVILLMASATAMSNLNTTGEPIGVTGAAADLPTPWIAGRRATAQVRLEPLGLENVVTAPADAFRRVRLQPEGTLKDYEIFSNHVIRHLVEPDGRTSRLTFLAAVEWPWVVLLIDRGERPADARGDEQPLIIDVECEANLDYMNQFSAADPQHYQWIDKGFVVVSSDHPDLNNIILTDARVEVQGPNTADVTPGQPIKARLYFATRQGLIAWGAAEDDLFWKILPETNRAAFDKDLKHIVAAEQATSGAQPQTPDEDLNKFMRLTRFWLHKSVRLLPVGTPYKADAENNEEIAVPTDAPEQPRLSTTGSVQFMREALLFTPELRPVYQNALHVLHEHAKNLEESIPASITFGGGARKLTYDRIARGQHAYWIIAAVDLILWTGDREFGEKLWPDIETVLEQISRPDRQAVASTSPATRPSTSRSAETISPAELHALNNRAVVRGAHLADFLGKREQAGKLRRESPSSNQTTGNAPNGQPKPTNACCAARAQDHDIFRADFWTWRDRTAIDKAIPELTRRAGEELALGLPAACAWPLRTDTPTGCLLASARALRTISAGLFGLEAVSDGLEIDPHLPRSWPSMTLSQVPFRGRTLDINVKRGEQPAATLNGKPWKGPLVAEKDLQSGENRLEIIAPREP